jgi:4-deoxy-L-threo-5-hexosulose-uronate ketol-isomerase
MKELDIRYANHPDDSKHYTTEELRKHYLIENVFVKDDISLTYSHQDRMIAGGAYPVTKALKLEAGDALRTKYFLERRELGVFNIGGDGKITLDGKEYILHKTDCLYVGMGTKDVVFESLDSKNPAKFYMCSSPAHKSYPTVYLPIEKARKVPTGDQEHLNCRTINQFIHSDVLDTCQLSMGLTILAPGNAWNTMPSHTHERRMEVYFYFELGEDDVVFHLMGQPQEIRTIVIKNEQAVISPSWSIHSGFATKSYAFIWGMCGENKAYDDMDVIKSTDLK